MTKHHRYNRSEKGRARSRRYNNAKRPTRPDNARRVFGASGYLGMAPTAETAEVLNDLRREYHARKNQG